LLYKGPRSLECVRAATSYDPDVWFRSKDVHFEAIHGHDDKNSLTKEGQLQPKRLDEWHVRTPYAGAVPAIWYKPW
jgi:hypothetical protein